MQALLPLDDGSAVKVTIAHYYTPAGHDIHKKGLEPDVEIELELDEDQMCIRDRSMAGIIESSGNPEEEALNLQRIGNKLDLLEQVVDDYFLFEEDVDTEQMEAGIYKGMLAGLEDPYTTYYTAEEYRAMTEETEGVYCGIGVQVSQNLETGIITILRVFPGSPAEEAGLKKGCLLYTSERPMQLSG